MRRLACPNLPLLAALALLAPACSGGTGVLSDAGVPLPVQTCDPGAAPAAAKVPAGTLSMQKDGSVILPGGRRLSPLGMQWDGVGGFPMSMRLLDSGKYLIIYDGGYADEDLTLLDTSDGHAVQQFVFPAGKDAALFWGIAVASDGKTLYLSGGGSDQVYVYSFDATNPTAPLAADPAMDLHATPPGTPYSHREYLAGLAFTPDGKYLYAAAQLGNNGNLDVFDPTSPAAPVFEFPAGANPAGSPYDVAFAPAGSPLKEAYLSLWGKGEVVVLDVSNETAPKVAGTIAVGKNPERLTVVPDATTPAGFRLFVDVSDDGTIAEIDPMARKVIQTIPVAPQAKAPAGVEPNDFLFTSDGKRLLVADAGENAVSVIDTSTWAVVGAFPAGWWPTALAMDGATGRVYVANGKGMGVGPRLPGQGVSEIMHGTVSAIDKAVLDVENDKAVAAQTATVLSNLARPASLQSPVACDDPAHPAFPIPQKPGDPTPIQHVIFLVRENKTYDAVLGDERQGGANGDASYVLFGRHFTPNAHALAEQFSNFDNFYDDSEQSIQGHEWTTSASTNDWLEKAWLTTWGRAYRSVGQTTTSIAAPAGGYIWQNLIQSGVSYADEGELIGSDAAKPAAALDAGYGFFDLTEHDVDRAAYLYQKWFDPTSATDDLPQFVYAIVPDDHTQGTKPGAPTPESMVEDNDEGTGRIVDMVSHSKYWASTLVIVVEDDPSDGADHVESHRSLCLLISPWVKRGVLSHTNYDYASIYRTIEAILGMPPMGIYDANAALMNDVFTRTPDLTPYTYIPRADPETINSPWAPDAAESARIDFTHPDTSPDLDRIVWEERTGKRATWAHPVQLPDPDGDGE